MHLSNEKIQRDWTIEVGGQRFGFRDIRDENFDPPYYRTTAYLGPWWVTDEFPVSAGTASAAIAILPALLLVALIWRWGRRSRAARAGLHT